MWRGVELGLDRVTRPTGPGAVGATALDHEPINDSVKRYAIVEADLGEPDQILTVTGRNFREQVEEILPWLW